MLVVTQILTSDPWYLRASKWLERRELRGNDLLMRLVKKLAQKPILVEHELYGRPFLVPILRDDNRWDSSDLHTYESAVVRSLKNVTANWPKVDVVIDCGADIGLMSRKLLGELEPIEIVAIEPNETAFEYLKKNMEFYEAARLLNCAVGREAGVGNLREPDWDSTEHGWYIAYDRSGALRIDVLDRIVLRRQLGCIVAKIDVEGAELAVVEGFQRTLRQATRIAIAFEAHPFHVQRTGVDPLEVVRRIESIRECKWFVAEEEKLSRDLGSEEKFYEVMPGKVYNVICVCE